MSAVYEQTMPSAFPYQITVNKTTARTVVRALMDQVPSDIGAKNGTSFAVTTDGLHRTDTKLIPGRGRVPVSQTPITIWLSKQSLRFLVKKGFIPEDWQDQLKAHT